MDPRPAILERRLATVGRLVGVTGGKGGVGKSSVASGLALALAERGREVGLLDLDFCGPSSHVILGIGNAQPAEEEGNWGDVRYDLKTDLRVDREAKISF